ncbi:MFS transporter [Hydrocarboniphaga sp.]|uniref:MFS transporter n=1 Tax=Hydrocarboniphaga sp. TaxID=2033016 RepID=UPI003D129C45
MTDTHAPAMGPALTTLFAVGCGLIVANLYYGQPLIGLIGPELGLPAETISLVVTLTQIGYGLGLLLIVPLGDRLENRRLLAGILLARPVASMTAHLFGWRAIYAASALLMVVLALVLRRALPARHPSATMRYPQLLHSLYELFRDTPLLRRRSAYHAAMFGAFSLFWSAIALLLASPAFGYSQSGIAAFALAGAAGALCAPFAGRLADRGLTRPATGAALALAALAFVIAAIGAATTSVSLLLIAALLLDVGVSLNLVLGQRSLYALGDAIRSRLNALYMSLFFAGGAVGSALAGWAWARHGWNGVCVVGLAFALAALLYFATEFGSRRSAASRSGGGV